MSLQRVTRLVPAAALVAIGALVGGGGILAHEARSQADITACIEAGSNHLYLPTSRGCPEGSIVWNQQGPAGAEGPAGIQGPAGPAGQQGPAGAQGPAAPMSKISETAEAARSLARSLTFNKATDALHWLGFQPGDTEVVPNNPLVRRWTLWCPPGHKVVSGGFALRHHVKGKPVDPARVVKSGSVHIAGPLAKEGWSIEAIAAKGSTTAPASGDAFVEATCVRAILRK